VAVAKLVFGAIVAVLFAHGGSPEGGLYLLPLVPIAIRGAMVRASTEGDTLRVRNFWSSFHLRRDEIERFEVRDFAYWGLNSTVRVHPRRGRSRDLAAVGVHRHTLWFLGRRGRAADAICAELNDWLRTGA
jgi:hypothetical protein